MNTTGGLTADVSASQTKNIPSALSKNAGSSHQPGYVKDKNHTPSLTLKDGMSIGKMCQTFHSSFVEYLGRCLLAKSADGQHSEDPEQDLQQMLQVDSQNSVVICNFLFGDQYQYSDQDFEVLCQVEKALQLNDGHHRSLQQFHEFWIAQSVPREMWVENLEGNCLPRLLPKH